MHSDDETIEIILSDLINVENSIEKTKQELDLLELDEVILTPQVKIRIKEVKDRLYYFIRKRRSLNQLRKLLIGQLERELGIDISKNKLKREKNKRRAEVHARKSILEGIMRKEWSISAYLDIDEIKRLSLGTSGYAEKVQLIASRALYRRDYLIAKINNDEHIPEAEKDYGSLFHEEAEQILQKIKEKSSRREVAYKSIISTLETQSTDSE